MRKTPSIPLIRGRSDRPCSPLIRGVRGVSVFLLVTYCVIFPSLTQAAPFGFPDPLNNASVPQIVGRLVYAALSLAGAVFFVMFLWGGFTYMTAGGESKKVESAQKTLVNAVIGMILLATSYVIVSTIIGILGAGIK